MIKCTAVLLALVMLVASSSPAQAGKRKKGKKLPPTTAQVFKKLDRDGDGKLTLTEVENKATGKKLTKLDQTFKRLDKDADGSLTPAEFTAFYRTKGKGKRPAASPSATTPASPTAPPASSGSGK